MSDLEDIYKLQLLGVQERGEPNQERIVLYAAEPVEMDNYAIALGYRIAHGQARPISDRFFWFGTGEIKKGEWIHLYTGPGSYEKTKLKESEQPVYAFYWGHQKTILNDENVVPILFQMNGTIIEQTFQQQLPQQR